MLAGYYASRALTDARKNNSPDQTVEERRKIIKEALWAPFYHKKSSDAEVDHRYCGAWCPYVKAKTAGKADVRLIDLARSLPQSIDLPYEPIYLSSGISSHKQYPSAKYGQDQISVRKPHHGFLVGAIRP